MADLAQTPAQGSIELGDNTSTIDRASIQALPRADGGRQAYLFLAACFVLEATVWGFPLAFGVFQTYYTTHEPFASSPGGIPAIATTATGLMYLGAPLAAYTIARWPYIRNTFFWLGFGIVVASLIGASFAQSTAALLATQGVFYAIGGLLLYFPAISLLDEWFIAKKGLAFGVMWAGTGTSGAVVPFLMQWLLDEFGHRVALRVWTVIFSALVIPALLVAKPRLPITPANRVRPTDWKFLKSTLFWVFEAGVIFQGLGFFLPQLWIPSFAASFGFPSYAGPLALSLYNVLAIAGSILTGMLCDKFHVTTAILITTLGSTVAAFVFWGLSSSQPMFYAFALVWGLFAGGYSTTWSGCAAALRRSGFHNLDTSPVLSLLAAGKGIGSIVSGPMSASLLHLGPMAPAGSVYGTSYGNLVIFTGVTTVLGGTAWVGKQLRLL